MQLPNWFTNLSGACKNSPALLHPCPSASIGVKRRSQMKEGAVPLWLYPCPVSTGNPKHRPEACRRLGHNQPVWAVWMGVGMAHCRKLLLIALETEVPDQGPSRLSVRSAAFPVMKGACFCVLTWCRGRKRSWGWCIHKH